MDDTNPLQTFSGHGHYNFSNSTNGTSWTPPTNLTALEGHFVDRTYQPGFVILAYIVSFVGAWTALELINMRTSIRGWFNWWVLAGSSISMGGIATWCMHFTGNRAVILGHGEAEIQIAYSAGFTTASFFLPVVVVIIAFGVVGYDDRLSKTRIIMGGTLQGLGLVCMHYVGQAGIYNYECHYDIAFVIPALFVAILSSIGALGAYFLFRAQWSSCWWKRGICAKILSLGVSGMHWLASIGTLYKLRKVNPSQVKNVSRTSTVIIIIVMSLLGSATLLTLGYLAQRRMRKAAKRAQQLVLAAMVFDNEGRILVSSEGSLPLRKITDAWLERSLEDVFNISHPVFLWIFRTSRNWLGVGDLIPHMRDHIHRTGIRGRLNSKFDSSLLDEEGTPIREFYLVFQELFCVTAADLANDLKQPLSQMGVLYEEFINTGDAPRTKMEKNSDTSSLDLEREAAGQLGLGKGQILFLVNHVSRRTAEDLQAAGYRFTPPASVLHIIASRLQMSRSALRLRIDAMTEYNTELPLLDPGLHFAMFAVQATIGVGKLGFNILARKDAKNLIPTMQVMIQEYQDWMPEYLKRLENLNVITAGKFLHKGARQNNPNKKEQNLAQQLLHSLEALKKEIQDPIFNDATVLGKVFETTCHGKTHKDLPGVAHVISFRIIVPIHGRAPGKKLHFVPSAFFKMCQHLYKGSPDHYVFTRKTYDDFSELLQLEERRGTALTSSPLVFLSPFVVSAAKRVERTEVRLGDNVDSNGNPIKPNRLGMPKRAPSRMRFWDRSGAEQGDDAGGQLTAQEYNSDAAEGSGRDTAAPPRRDRQEFLGIELHPMKRRGRSTAQGLDRIPAKDFKEQVTWIDELFKTTITTRQF